MAYSSLLSFFLFLAQLAHKLLHNIGTLENGNDKQNELISDSRQRRQVPDDDGLQLKLFAISTAREPIDAIERTYTHTDAHTHTLMPDLKIYKCVCSSVKIKIKCRNRKRHSQTIQTQHTNTHTQPRTHTHAYTDTHREYVWKKSLYNPNSWKSQTGSTARHRSFPKVE